MIKKTYPMKRLQATIDGIGTIELTELTTAYRERAMDDPAYDNPKNALICAGMTEEQFGSLGHNIAMELYKDIIDLTYPNAMEELKKMMESGEYEEPTEEEREELKKNS